MNPIHTLKTLIKSATRTSNKKVIGRTYVIRNGIPHIIPIYARKDAQGANR